MKRIILITLKKKIVPDNTLYPKIDPRMIFTQGYNDIYIYSMYLTFNTNNDLDPKIQRNITKFKKTLIRICSYFN